MDFKKIVPLLIKRFDKDKINYALMGGFSLGFMGIMRATMDLDFLVDKEDMNKVDKVMRSLGYERVYMAENVSQYVGTLKELGEVDYLHAFRKVSLSMLKRAKEYKMFSSNDKIRVLRPEDVIGLKVQALINDNRRKSREYSDIEEIMSRFGKKLDWALLKEYFELFDVGKEYKKFKDKYGNV